MACKSCHSENQRSYRSEICIHPPRGHLEKPAILAYPSLLVCLNCGFTELVLAESEKVKLLYNDANYWESACGDGS